MTAFRPAESGTKARCGLASAFYRTRLKSMRIKYQVVFAVVVCAVLAGTSRMLLAQWQGTSAAKWAGTGKVPPSTSELAGAGDVKSAVFKWMWYMGMLRGVQELDTVATFELRKATGTIRVD